MSPVGCVAILLCALLVAGCDGGESFACKPTGEMGVRQVMYMVKPVMFKRVTVERHTCTDGEDRWLEVLG